MDRLLVRDVCYWQIVLEKSERRRDRHCITARTAGLATIGKCSQPQTVISQKTEICARPKIGPARDSRNFRERSDQPQRPWSSSDPYIHGDQSGPKSSNTGPRHGFCGSGCGTVDHPG